MSLTNLGRGGSADLATVAALAYWKADGKLRL